MLSYYDNFRDFFSKWHILFLRRKLDVPTYKGFEGRSWSHSKVCCKFTFLFSYKYAKIERGEVALTADVLVQLSKLYNVSADYLLGLTDYPDRIKHKIK